MEKIKTKFIKKYRLENLSVLKKIYNDLLKMEYQGKSTE
jgi:hypothetical protein